ncbi:hypothetical protein KC338_g311 [Hortaea werneckii]|nr:hypothetical protein KC338_g311 [Hortaea werneckii]
MRPRTRNYNFPRVVEPLVHIADVPVAVEVDRVRDVDGLEAVVEGDRRRPHLREHGVLLLPDFVVHGLQQTAGEPCYSDNSCAAWWHGQRPVVARYVPREDPVGQGRVEEGVEDYKVRVFADAPLVVVFFPCGRGLGAVGAREHACVREVLDRAPNRYRSALFDVVLGDVAFDCFLLDEGGEVLPITVWPEYRRSISQFQKNSYSGCCCANHCKGKCAER